MALPSKKSAKHKLFNGLHIHFELLENISFYFGIEKKSRSNIERHFFFFFFPVSFPTALEHENSRELVFDEATYVQ
jgi:hypothetical protein